MKATNETNTIERLFAKAQAEKKQGNREQAIFLYKLLAEKNCKHAQFELGLMYTEDGQDEQAFKYHQLAASQDHAMAEYCLSQCFLTGKGSPIINLQQAFNYCKQSADHGFLHAQYQLAGFYKNGTGTEKNYNLTIKLLEQTAEQNYIDALYQLGKEYLTGDIVAQNKQMAMHYFEIITKIEPDESQINMYFDTFLILGECYLTGDEKNLANACQMFCSLLFQVETRQEALSIIKKTVSDAACALTFLDFAELIQYALIKHDNDLFAIYLENLEIKFEAAKHAPEQACNLKEWQRPMEFYNSLKKLQPKDLMTLVFEELKKPSDKIRSDYVKHHLNKILSYQEKEHANILREACFYYGLCELYGVFGEFNSELGFNHISISKVSEFPRAQEFFKIKTDPHSKMAASIYQKEGDYSFEQKLYHLARFHYTSALKTQHFKGNLKIDIQFKQAMCDWHMDYLDKACLQFSAILKQKPEHKAALDKLMEYEVKKNNLDQAVSKIKDNKAYLEHLRINKKPGSWMEVLYAAHLCFLGKEKLHQNARRSAFRYFMEARSLGSISALIESGICYFEGWGVKQNPSEAFLSFQLALDHPTGYFYLGIMYEHGLGIEINKKSAEYYLKTFPDNTLAVDYLQKSTTLAGLIELGDSALDKKMYQLALCHYLNALEKEALNIQPLLKIGICYLRKNKLDEACKYIEQALALNPQSEEAILASIECQTLLNKLPTAIALIEQHQALWLRYIAQSTKNEPWEKILQDAFEKQAQEKIIQKEQAIKTTQLVEMPQRITTPRPKKREVKKNPNKHFSSHYIAACCKEIDTCNNADQFLSILEKIICGNMPKILRETSTQWFSKHPADRDYILQKMDGKGEIFQKYKLLWEQLPIEPVVMVPDESSVEAVMEAAPVKTDIPQIPLPLTLFHKPLSKEPVVKKGIFNLDDIENLEQSRPQKVVVDSPFNLFKPAEKTIETEIDGEIYSLDTEAPFDFDVQSSAGINYSMGYPVFDGVVKIFATTTNPDFLDKVNRFLADLVVSIMMERIFHRSEFSSGMNTTGLTLVTDCPENHAKIQKMVAVLSEKVTAMKEACIFSSAPTPFQM